MEFLRSSWVVLRRRWPVILLCLALALVGVSAYKATRHTVYTASAELFLRAPEVKGSASAYQGDLFSRQRAQSYIKLFSSEDLAQMVIDKLGLQTTPQELTSQVQASAVRDTVLIVVSATDSNPQRAANIANGYASMLGTYIARLENIENNPNIPPLIQVVTSASPDAVIPSGYSWKLLLIGAVAAGLLVALLLIWFLERYDTKIRSRKQIENVTSSKVIGTIPTVSKLGAKGTVGDNWLLVNDLSQSAIRLSINIDSVLGQLSNIGVPPIVTVVSEQPGVGTSVVARAIARAWVERGRTVGYIDADRDRDWMETRRLVLGSAADMDDVLNSLSNPLSSATNPEEADAALDELRKTCEIIVIDSPAFADAAQAQVLMTTADAILLVVRPGSTDATALRELSEAAVILGTPILGVVANLAKEAMTVDNAYL